MSVNPGKRILFLSFLSPDYSRSSTLLNYQSEKLEKEYIQLTEKFTRYILELFRLRAKFKDFDLIVVMSPCHILSIFLRILSKKPILLDAGWPLTDGVFSRGINLPKLPHLVKVYLIDFLAFHSATHVFAESKIQRARISKNYFLRSTRITVVLTGLVENYFLPSQSASEECKKIKQKISDLNNPTTVIFRGKINKESGIELIMSAAKQLEKEVVFILVTGSKDVITKDLGNVIQVSDISFSDMTYLYSLSDISIGQVSENKRLSYTIPHKAFEAAFLGIPYISSKTAGIMEFLGEDAAVYLDANSPGALVESIKSVSNPIISECYSLRMREMYRSKASQEIANSNLEILVFG